MCWFIINGTKYGVFKEKDIHRKARRRRSYQSLTNTLLTDEESVPFVAWGSPLSSRLSLVRRAGQLGTRLWLSLLGKQVGSGSNGLRYFIVKGQDWAGRESRAVLYAGEPEVSFVPPAARAWLAHLTDRVPQESDGGAPNLTGSDGAWLPPGHALRRLRGEPVPAGFEEKRRWMPPET